MPTYAIPNGAWTISRKEFRQMALPYGKWTCADGREVLFNRFYTPICERLPGQQATRANRNEWVPWKQQEWFYDDGTPEPKKRKNSIAVLNAWGMTEEIMKEIERQEKTIRKRDGQSHLGR
jgi:hypothetical protein